MPRTVVGVMNTSEDTTDMLRTVLEKAGYVVVTAFTNRLRDGLIDIEVFMRQHQPRVIVYDIAVPYQENWALFQHISSLPALAGVRFVLTTTNAAQVRKVAGAGQDLHEIVGKPYDLHEVVQAVKEAEYQRPTR